MGALRKHVNNEFQVSNLYLEHESASTFYVGCWQKNRSCVPLLCIRTLLFATNLAIIIASLAILTQTLGGFGYWCLYLTHWGLIVNTVTTGFAFAISVRVYFGGPIDALFGLPWYVKAYWVMFNLSIPMAFLITIFYWSFISGSEEFQNLEPVLDVFIHGINSVVMMLLLMTARHPSRFLHFYHAIGLGLLYLFFNLIYYFAGGLDSFGNVWIYPMLDWSSPGVASVVVVMVAIGIFLLHAIVVLLSICRNYFSKIYRNDNRSFSVSG